jgi:hypothetical protein
MKWLLFLVILTTLVTAKMTLLPKSLRGDIGNEDGNIPFSIANFGLIPYGHTVMATLKYSSENEDGCSAFGSSLKGAQNQSPIVVVKRGGCSFVQKVRNVEHGGGKLAVIVDEEDNENPQTIIMVDDGTGNGIQIPSVMIGKTQGNALIAKLLDFADKGKEIQMIVTFEIDRPDDRVEYEFWFTSSNDRGLDFISDFKSFHEKLGKKVLMTPRYFSWACINCDESITDTDCFCDGKYCAIDETNLRVKGQTILHEDLRQKCIYKNAMKNTNSDAEWWAYVTKAHSICHSDFSEDCSKEVHTMLEMDYDATEACVNDSFSNSDHTKGDNTILSEEVEAWNMHGAHYIPSVIVNNVAYRGTLDPENVFNAICNGYKDPQEE